MRHLLIIVLSIITLSGVAQTTNKKRVLVIPCSRFEFVSEFSIDEMAEKNQTTSDKVFLVYEKGLLNSFETYTDDNFEFIPVAAAALKPYKKLIKYKYGKFDGKRHNAVDLKSFTDEQFAALLDYHKTDFVIFITWYDIQKEAFVRKGSTSKRAPYAGHYIDFDIYNLFKQQVTAKGRVKANAAIPNDLEVTYKLLRAKELASAYQNFIDQIVALLNNPIEQ